MCVEVIVCYISVVFLRHNVEEILTLFFAEQSVTCWLCCCGITLLSVPGKVFAHVLLSQVC